MRFIARACEESGIPFYILHTDLYGHYMKDFGAGRVVSIPFWGIDEDGKNNKKPRICTIDFKIQLMQKFVRYDLLGYRPGEKLRKEDVKGHEMHIGFSKEEQQRIFDNPCPLFVNKSPLIGMSLERPDNYRYCLEVWGLKTWASACIICPFHRNYFFRFIKRNAPEDYEKVLRFDRLLEELATGYEDSQPPVHFPLSKRIRDLTESDCYDAQTFE